MKYLQSVNNFQYPFDITRLLRLSSYVHDQDKWNQKAFNTLYSNMNLPLFAKVFLNLKY